MIHTILIKWPPTLFFRFHRVMVIFQIKWNKMEYMYNFNPAYMCCYYDITYYSDLSYKTSQDLYLFLVLPFSKFIHVISARLSETPECLFMNYSINEHYLNIHAACALLLLTISGHHSFSRLSQNMCTNITSSCLVCQPCITLPVTLSF